MRVIKVHKCGEAWIELIKEILEVHELFGKNEIQNVGIVIENPTEDSSYFLSLYSSEFDKKIFDDVFSRVSKGEYYKRLRNFNGIDQLDRVIKRLRRRKYSTRLSCSIYHPSDFTHRYVPCILMLEFRRRKNLLDLTAFIRSEDVCRKGLPDYLGLASILREVSRKSNLKEGKIYAHIVTAYIRKKDIRSAERIIKKYSI